MFKCCWFIIQTHYDGRMFQIFVFRSNVYFMPENGKHLIEFEIFPNHVK